MISLERLARGSLRFLPSVRRSRRKSVSNRKTRLRRKGARDYEEERKPLAFVPQTAPSESNFHSDENSETFRCIYKWQIQQ